MDADIRYVAQLAHVREVSLLGSADPSPWHDLLGEVGLAPAEHDGRARLLLSATDSRFKGIPFRELTISVFARRPGEGANRDRLYLACAFNSSRLLSFVERAMFSTPYRHGDVSVDVRPPASIRLHEGPDPIFRVEMSPDESGRSPTRIGDDGWSGILFLPRSRRRDDAPSR